MDPIKYEIPSPMANKNRLLCQNDIIMDEYVKTFTNHVVQLADFLRLRNTGITDRQF